jgi:hypothetical protein
MSKTIARWGVDLASFTGYAGGAKGAADAIVDSLMGENEKLKGLRIVIREDSEEFRNMTREMMATKNVSEEHAKVFAKLQLITQKAAKAKNDYIAPGENFTQSVNNLNEQIKQMTSDIGQVIYEGLRLNDVFTWLGDEAKTITKWWSKEGEKWIFLIRKFVNDFVALGKIAALPFTFLWENIKIGFNNVINMGSWFNDNWSKIWTNGFDIVKAVFLDIWEYFKWFWGPDGIIPGFFKTAGGAIWDAIKVGIKGGDVGQVFKDAFSGYIDKNVIEGFAKQGKNIEAAMAKAGISSFKWEVADFSFSDRYGEIMDELNRKQQLEKARFEKRTKGKQNERTSGQDALSQEAKKLQEVSGKSFGAFSAADLSQQLAGSMAPAQKTADNTGKAVDVLRQILARIPSATPGATQGMLVQSVIGGGVTQGPQTLNDILNATEKQTKVLQKMYYQETQKEGIVYN